MNKYNWKYLLWKLLMILWILASLYILFIHFLYLHKKQKEYVQIYDDWMSYATTSNKRDNNVKKQIR